MSRDADLVLRGRIDWSDVFADMDRLEARVDQFKAKVRSVGRGSGPSQNEREGARLAREAKAAADAEARAFARRVASENRQRAESAKLARQLRRDEERDLKAFGDRQRRETQSRLRDHERLERETARRIAKDRADAERAYRQQVAQYRRQQSEAARVEDRQRAASISGWTGVTQAVLRATVVVAAFVVAVAGIAAAKAADALYDFAKAGIEFNAQMESARLGIGSLIAAFYEVKTAGGATLEGGEKLAASIRLAEGEMQKLRIRTLETTFTSQELAAAYQQALGAAASAQIPLGKVLDLTVKISQAGGAIGLEGRQMNEEVRSLLSGTVTMNSRIAQALGITGAMVRDWKEQGTLVEELEKRLDGFALAGGLAQKTFAGLASNLRDALAILAGDSTRKLFESLKGTFGDVITRVFNLETAKVRPQVQTIVDLLDDSFGEAGARLRGYVNSILDGLVLVAHWVDENHKTVLEIVNAAFALTEQVAGLIADMASLAVETELSVKGYENAGGAAAELRDVVRGIGLAVAITRDVLSDVPAVINTAGGALRLAVAVPLQAILKGSGKIVDLFVNLTEAARTTGAALAAAGAALTSGNFAEAIAAFQAIPSVTDLAAVTAQGAAVANVLDSYVEAGKALRDNYKIIGQTFFQDRFKESAGRRTSSALRADAGITTTAAPGDRGAADAGKLSAEAQRAEKAAQKFAAALEKVNDEVERMKDALPITEGQLARVIKLLGGRDPVKNLEAFQSAMTKAADIARDADLTGGGALIDQAAKIRAEAEQAVSAFSEGFKTVTKNGIEEYKPTIDQIAEYRNAVEERTALKFFELTRKSVAFEASAREKIAGLQDQLADGATAVAKEYERLENSVRAFKAEVESKTLLRPEEQEALIADFENASKSLFNEEQSNRAKAFYTDIASLRADLETDASKVALAQLHAEQLEFETAVRDKIKDETEADKIIAAHRQALHDKYWREERRFANEVANEQKALEIALISNQRERIKAARELAALSAAQAKDPSFDPNAPRTGQEGPQSAGAIFDRGLDTDKLRELVELSAELRTNLDFAGSALAEGLDTGRIAEAAERLQELGLSFGDVARAIGFTATNLASFELQLSALEKYKAGNIIGGIVDSFKGAVVEVAMSTETFTKLGQALGQTLAGNAGSIKEFGKQLLITLIGVLSQIMITLGSAILAIGLGLSSAPLIFGLQGAAAVAGGLALIAAGVALAAGAAALGSSGQSQAGAAAAAVAPASSNVTPIEEGRRRRQIRGGEFNSSGESTDRRPLSFFGGAGGRQGTTLRIETNDPILAQLLENGVLTVDNVQQHGVLTVKTINRGSVRKQAKRKLSA